MCLWAAPELSDNPSPTPFHQGLWNSRHLPSYTAHTVYYTGILHTFTLTKVCLFFFILFPKLRQRVKGSSKSFKHKINSKLQSDLEDRSVSEIMNTYPMVFITFEKRNLIRRFLEALTHFRWQYVTNLPICLCSRVYYWS